MPATLAQSPVVKPTRAGKDRLKFRQLVILFSTAVCLFYLTYRGLFTLNLSTPYAVFCSL